MKTVFSIIIAQLQSSRYASLLLCVPYVGTVRKQIGREIENGTGTQLYRTVPEQVPYRRIFVTSIYVYHHIRTYPTFRYRTVNSDTVPYTDELFVSTFINFLFYVQYQYQHRVSLNWNICY